MINLSKMIERNFREFLDENGGKSAIIKNNGDTIEICLEEGDRGEFDDYLNEYAKSEAYFIRRDLELNQEPEFTFKDENTLSFQCVFPEN